MLDRTEKCTGCGKPCILEKDKIAHFDNDLCSDCEKAMFQAMEEDGFTADLMSPHYAF